MCRKSWRSGATSPTWPRRSWPRTISGFDETTNFDTLKTAAGDIHSRAGEPGFDAFASSGMDDSSSRRFTGHMANLEYHYEQEGSVWTECPPAITGKYLDNYKNLYDLCINNSTVSSKELATGGYDAAQEFKDGKAAFYVNGSWEYEGLKDAVPSVTMIRRLRRGKDRPELRNRERLGHAVSGRQRLNHIQRIPLLKSAYDALQACS